MLGVISFVAEDREQQQFQHGNPPATADGVDAIQIVEFQTAGVKKTGMFCFGKMRNSNTLTSV